jgi:hypothetical protein
MSLGFAANEGQVTIARRTNVLRRKIERGLAMVVFSVDGLSSQLESAVAGCRTVKRALGGRDRVDWDFWLLRESRAAADAHISNGGMSVRRGVGF